MVIEPWKLEKAAKCYNCGDASVHEILVNEYKMEIKCRECGFTRYYSFHILDIPKKEK